MRCLSSDSRGRCVSRVVAAGVLAAGASHALSAVTVTSGWVDAFSNGTVGRQGSTSGNNVDDPPQLLGTSGILTLSTLSSGGPVAPGPIITLPGTVASHLESSSVYQWFEGDGIDFLRVTQQARVNNSLTNMDGAGLVGGSNASASSRMVFSINVATPYTLTGTLLLDDQDVAGFVRLTNGIGIALYSRSVANNGAFTTSGTLNPGMYILQSSCNVTSVVGQPDVGSTGNFAESGSLFAVLTLGTPPACDAIDFNNNGVFPEDQDVVDFFDILAGGTPATCNGVVGCNDIDFNNNGVFPEDQDVVDFFNVLAGGTCP
jgi:hypothetical protein